MGIESGKKYIPNHKQNGACRNKIEHSLIQCVITRNWSLTILEQEYFFCVVDYKKIECDRDNDQRL